MVMMSMNSVYNNFLACLCLLPLFGCDDDSIVSLSEHSIIYCAEGSPETFNPQLITSGTTIDATSNQLYDRLLTFHGKENILTPALAKSWHVTRDGKKVTFYLRKNVPFHQTDYFKPSRFFNADDVIFSFNRILKINHPFHFVSGGSYPFFQNIELDKLVEKIEKINDHTIRFHLTHADNAFLANLATDYAIILSQEYGAQLTKQNNRSNIDTYPIGTGPFKLKEYRVGSFIRFYRHDQYWRKSAKIEQLVFDITPSNTGRLTKLLAKECDVTAYPIAHEIIEKNKNLTLESITALNVGYFGFNVNKPPFDNKLVRQAVSYAINKQVILETIYQDKAELANSLLPHSSWAYDDSIPAHTYNPIKAKRLLALAGFEQGFTMDLWAMPIRRPYNPNAITMAKLIQSDLKNIGIKVNIVSYEWNTFLSRLKKGQHQSFLLGWSADHPNPDNFFSPLLSCSAINTGSNNTFWCSQAHDDLIQKALQSSLLAQRKQYYSQAMQIITEEIPLIPIAHSKRYQARSRDVKGTILTAFGGINFYAVDRIKKRPIKVSKTEDSLDASAQTGEN